MIDYEKLAEGVMFPPKPEGADSGKGDFQAQPPRRDYIPVTDERYQNLASEKGYDQSTARLKVVHYTHEAMIDVIIAEPAITQNELAKKFERTVPWISRIMGSDAFQGALAKRREELTDPFLVATIEERFRGLAAQSLDIIAEKLEQTKNTDVALKALDISSKALGFGSRGTGGGNNTQNNFVIQLPPKMADSDSWVKQHSGKLIEG